MLTRAHTRRRRVRWLRADLLTSRGIASAITETFSTAAMEADRAGPRRFQNLDGLRGDIAGATKGVARRRER
jgi:hypothetical protein